jgi:ATP-dependent RNA helicase DDX51/DBP6
VRTRLQVVDEADRLLRQSYSEWLPRVVADTSERDDAQPFGAAAGAAGAQPGEAGDGADGGAGPGAAADSRGGFARVYRSRVVKLVMSATLTRDPSKIGALKLHCPRYIAMSATDHRQARHRFGGKTRSVGSWSLPRELAHP